MPDGFGGGHEDGYAAWPEFDRHLNGFWPLLGAIAKDALTPDPPFDLLNWTIENRVFDEGSSNPGAFDPSVAPYLNEMFSDLSPGRGVEEASIIKCAQSGGTVVLESFFAAVPAAVAGPAMLVHPTIRAFEDWTEEKWWPMVFATACLDPDRGGVVKDRTGRTEGGSTSKRLRFTNGSWIVGAGANSAATLRQKSIRYLGLDDLDGFEESAGDEGDPENLADQRIKTFRRRGLAVKLRCSTPLLEGSSRITKHYENSDRRRFYHRCLSEECRDLTDFDWEDVEKNDAPPYDCHISCPSCGTVYTHAEKNAMQLEGAWIPTAPVDGQLNDDGEPLVPPKTIAAGDLEIWRTRDMRHLANRRGWWITGFMNFAETWDSIAEQETAAGSDPDTRKVFDNTVLGRPFKLDTKTADWEELYAHRSNEFRQGEGAYGPCVFVLSADVQGYGIYWLAKGYNRNEEQWYLDWGLVPGETAVAGEGAWPEFDKVAERGAPLPGGGRASFDAELIDSNYNTPAVKAWTKRRPLAVPINGDDGWGKDIIYRTHQSEVGKTGRKKKLGQRVWHVGTYPAKAVMVARYGRTVSLGVIDETGVPNGYCWFPANVDEVFLRQLTSEYVKEEKVKKTGRFRKTWAVRSGFENHYFDCDVYNFAGLTKLGARAAPRGTWTEENWAEREERVRTLIEEAGGQPDLFDRRGVAPSGAPVEERKEEVLPTALAKLARRNAGS